MNDLSEIGERIKNERLKKGLSVRALARLSGLVHSQISRLENNKSALTLVAYFQIVSALGLPFRSCLPGDVGSHFYDHIIDSTESDRQFIFPCFNFNDLFMLDYHGLLKSAKAESVIIELLQRLIMAFDRSMPNPQVTSVAHLLYNYLGVKNIDIMSPLQLPSSLPKLFDFRYPQELKLDILKKIYFSGGVVIHLDIGAYVRQVRTSHGVTLKALGKEIGFSHPGVIKIETQTAEKILLKDLINLDIALGLKGELLALSWRVAELYSGVYRTGPTLPTTLKPLQSFEIHAIEKLIVVSRLFQHYFSDDDSWIVWYRKQAITGFDGKEFPL